MLQGILIIVFMIAIMALMVTRKMPTVVALLVLTVGICLIGGVPAFAVDETGAEVGFIKAVIQSGAIKLADAMIVSVFAGWLGMIMEKTRISETMIKKGAELGGDKSLVVTLILFTVASLLFTVVNGLGTVIMVGTIVIPILSAVGVNSFICAAVMLFAYTVGNNSNLASLNVYASMLGADFEKIQLIGGICSVGVYIMGVLFILTQSRKAGKKFAFSAKVNEAEESDFEIKGITGALAMLTPLIPLILVIVFKFQLIAAFLVAIVWAIVFTCGKYGWKRTMNLLTKTLFDGFSATAPSVTLMVVIGMLLNAVSQPQVKEALDPFIRIVTPSTAITFVLFFVLLAPLTLYRGPLNIMGMGSGIAALMISLNILPLHAMAGAFVSVQNTMESVCDPTNTHDVWVAGFVGEEVTSVAKRLIIWVWPMTLLCVIVSAILWL